VTSLPRHGDEVQQKETYIFNTNHMTEKQKCLTNNYNQHSYVNKATI